jgi:hypothetical protein
VFIEITLLDGDTMGASIEETGLMEDGERVGGGASENHRSNRAVRLEICRD